MREFEVKPELEKKLIKLTKKDRPLYELIMKKMKEVVSSENIEHYKNLKYHRNLNYQISRMPKMQSIFEHDMKESKRVHIGHFVLVFSYDKSRDFISFEDFDHHDNIYKR